MPEEIVVLLVRSYSRLRPVGICPFGLSCWFDNLATKES